MGDITVLANKMREGCPAMRVRQAGRVLGRLYDDAFRSLGLELSQLPVLGAVAARRDTGISVTDLARVLVMDRTTVTRAIRPLDKAGLLRVARSPDDARSRIVLITRAGEQMLRDAHPLWERTTKRIREVFGGERIDALNAELAELVAASPRLSRAANLRARRG